jgi:hypothetical protein
MARKILNRKALREEVEAAEAGQASPPTEVKKKKAAKRKSRAKTPEEIRMKVFWGVYSQSMKRVAKYEFNQKKAAEKKAEELSKGKTPHFVKKDKEPVEE